MIFGARANVVSELVVKSKRIGDFARFKAQWCVVYFVSRKDTRLVTEFPSEVQRKYVESGFIAYSANLMIS